MPTIQHIPVLATETIDFVRSSDRHIFDGTFGHAGHTILALQKASDAVADATDRDLQTAQLGIDKLQELGLDGRVHLHHRSYADILEIADVWWVRYDYVLIDIGVNLQHFKDGARGFSTKLNWPLDMRFDTTQKKSAYHVINEYRVQQLTELFVKYGDFRELRAKLIAETIYSYRKSTPLATTHELVAVLEKAKCNLQDQNIIFQCIRIETNRELDELERFLGVAPRACALWWRIVVITFHSIEDRMVKQAMQLWEEQWLGKVLTKHVIKPSFAEIKRNPPSRSAKVRVFESCTDIL
jgi:16S rRNA (cytosine1402-N4)-methyltransferase